MASVAHNIILVKHYFRLKLLQMAESQSGPSSGVAAAGLEELDRSFDGLEDEDEKDESMEMSGEGGRRRIFSKELRCMLYGYGDDRNPYTETVDFLEDVVIQFIIDTTHKAMEIGRHGRVQVEDIIFLVRKHPRMYARVRELLTMNEELKKARKAFDDVKFVQDGKDAKGK